MQQNIALREKLINWVLFTLLSIIWGSSFILMKLGLETLSPYQVATLRMLSAGIILIPFALEGFRKIQKKEGVSNEKDFFGGAGVKDVQHN